MRKTWDKLNEQYNTMPLEEITTLLEGYYHHMFYKYARDLDYDDVRQELIIKTNDAINKYKDDMNAVFTTYLYTLCKHRIIDMLRENNEYRVMKENMKIQYSFKDYNTIYDRSTGLSLIDSINGELTPKEQRFIESYLRLGTVEKVAIELQLGRTTAYRLNKKIKEKLKEKLNSVS